MSGFVLDPDVRDVTMRIDGDRKAFLADRSADVSFAESDTTSDAVVVLNGLLGVPPVPVGAVLFAHGSGSSRHSPRNNAVARSLRERGLVTLLFDLLTPDESNDRSNVFNIELLASRLVAATAWAAQQPECDGLGVGFFGSSTGAAAALTAAAALPERVGAVVSRGGRPDLALHVLDRVVAPTLLIVGQYDVAVVDMNQTAYQQLAVERAMEIVPAATHLFEEPGALEQVSALAADWFVEHLRPLA